MPPFPPGCLVIVGLAAEAALLPTGVACLRSGGRVDRLRALLSAQARPSCVLSFGIAGGLEPGLASGALLVGEAVLDLSDRFSCDAGWVAAWVARTGGRAGALAASDAVIGSAAAKAALHRRTGALAVDMEGGVAARFAQAHGIPFAALRAVADPACDALVPSAAVGLDADGRPAPARVLASLVRRPQDLPGLIRIARQSRRALNALRLAVARATA